MKIKHLILSALAVASVAVSCKKEEASDKPSLTLNPTELSFEVAGGIQTVTVEANRDWSISDPDKIASWLTVEKKSDTEVEVTAAKNDGKDRTAEITLRMVGVKKSISISQKGEGGAVEPVEEGDGSLEKPYTAAQALAVTSALEKDAKTDKEYYVKGIVCEVKEISTQYGNATFWISDDGSNDKETRFYVFRAKDTNGASITDANRVKVGDVVVVYGIFQNYYGNTPQLSQGGQIVSVNGGDTPDTPVVEETTATGVVVALNSKGFLIKTDSGITYVFDSSKTPEVEIGDNVTVKGTETVYNGTPEITSYTVTVNSKGNAVTHPDATEITSDNIATYETLFGYVKTTGVLTITDRGYYNLAVDGASKTVSLAYAVGVDASFNGKNINVEGYFVGLTGTNGAYFNIVVTGASLSDVQPDPTPDPDPDPDPDPENPNAVTWTAGSNNSYDAEVKVGGTTYKGFKLGTSSKVGSIDVTIPAGVSKVTFYAGAWKGAAAGLKISLGETAVFNESLASFDGFTSNSPFTVSGVTDENKYTLDVAALNGGKALDAAVTVKVESVKADGTRVVVWNVVAE